jgi:hypothetical protein
MTEQEWLACTDPQKMLEFLRGKASERKLRLFACACCRIIWHLLTDARSQQAVGVAERFADGLTSFEQLHIAHEDAGVAARIAHDATFLPDDDTNEYPSSAATYASDDLRFWDMHHAAGVCASDTEWAVAVAIDVKGYRGPNPRFIVREAQASLFHDLFGTSLFRSQSAVSPDILNWNDATVQKIAQAIYDERAFDRMPILADALEESGCTDADILAHCRQPGEHVRGCWVVDLILGKE